jgi:flagellar biosynthesis protein FlhA
MRTVAEALTEAAARTQDVEQLTAMVRPKLGRMMIQNLLENRDTLSVMTLSPNLEQLLHSVYMQGNGSIAPVIEPQLAESLFTAMRRTSRQMEESGLPAVLVVSPNIRSWLSRMIRPRIPDITTLSYSEIPDDQAVKVVFTVEADANNRNN